MFRLLSLLLAVASASTGHLRGDSAGIWGQCGILGKARPRNQKQRIVHGKDAGECVWRWQVSLSTGSRQFCGGTLISPGHVITAAHCIKHIRGPCAVRSLRVLAGSWKRENGTASPAEERSAVRIFMHPLYSQNVPHDYDFAIIELDKAMPMNECIGLACLPRKDETPGTSCSITGWGTLKSYGRTPEVLQEASVKLLTPNDCEQNYTLSKDIITGSMLCASGVSDKGIVDTCQGDSGGPLSCAEDGRFVLRGVTSWGQGCAYANFPGVYGKVQSVMSWINDVIAQKVRKVYSDVRQEKMNISGINFNGSMWKVTKGNCTMDSSHCIMSPNYPKNYTEMDACVIAVNASAAVPIHVVNFSTEDKFDVLVEDCNYYSGTKGPENVVPKGTITWVSDQSVVSSGWKICPGQ